MIKAVIFDFFNVLAVRGTDAFRRTYFHSDPQKITEEKKLLDKLGLGNISYDDFITGLARIGGVERKTVLEFTEDYQANLELLEYIRESLKPHYKIGIISNAGQDWVLKVLGDGGFKLFDNIILSYKVGLIKPEAEIYELSAKNLDVKNGECVFVDDVMTYCQGAEAVGMNTVWYQNFEQMKAELKKLLSTAADN